MPWRNNPHNIFWHDFKLIKHLLIIIHKFDSVLSIFKNFFANAESDKANEHGSDKNYEMTTLTSIHKEMHLTHWQTFLESGLNFNSTLIHNLAQSLQI